MSQQQLDKLLAIFAQQPPLGSMSLEDERKNLDEGGARFRVPDDVVMEPVDVDGVPGEFLTAPGAADNKVVLYLHGGGYAIGSIKSHRYLMQNISRHAGAKTLGIDYRLAPENPFPAALEDATKAYRWLLAQGYKPENIAIGGDSAGGGLTLATLLHIRDKGLPQPRCAVLFSPASNAFPDDKVLAALDPSDAMLSADIIRTVIDIYLPDHADREHPYASPCLGDYSGVCPMLITACPDEVLYPDGKLVRKAAEKAGVRVKWIERPGLFHVWPIMVPFLPEANRDLKRVVEFIRTA